MTEILQYWRSFKEKEANLQEQEATPWLSMDNSLEGGITVDYPPEEDLEPPESIRRPEPEKTKKSAVIGSLRGTGKKPKYKTKTITNDDGTKTTKKIKIRAPAPFGLFFNGEHMGTDPRWILGANKQGNGKKNHYGTNELIKTIKKGIAHVHSTKQEEYDKLWLAYILGEPKGSTVVPDDQRYIDFLKKEKIIPESTQPLLIEDLGLAAHHTDIYGNTYHGGHKVPGHGSHQTGQDGDLGFYMMPGYEMVEGFRVASPPRKLLKGFLDRKELENMVTTLSTEGSTEKKEKTKRRRAQDLLTSLKNRLGTFDPIRTWKLISGMVNSGLINRTIIDKSFFSALKRASRLCGEASLYSKATFIGNVPNHKNHIHIRVNAPESVKRGTPLAKKLLKSFKKNRNTKVWIKSKGKKKAVTPGQDLYPERNPFVDIVDTATSGLDKVAARTTRK
tara:strand:- start:3848 stop:5188 length:1341 start_codon:yes stop_codon:yes gene_type:complete